MKKKRIVLIILCLVIFNISAYAHIRPLPLQIDDYATLGDYMGDIIEANLDTMEVSGHDIVLYNYWMNLDFVKLHMYHHTLNDRIRRGVVHTEPVTDAGMADGYRKYVLNDLDEDEGAFLYRDYLIIKSKVFIPGELTNAETSDSKAKIFVGNGYVHSNEELDEINTENPINYLRDLPTLNNQIYNTFGHMNPNHVDLTFYFPLNPLKNKFLALQGMQGGSPSYFYVEVDYDLEIKRDCGSPYDVKGSLRLPITFSQVPNSFKNVRRIAYNKLDYFQDIGRLRHSIDNPIAGRRTTVDGEYDFDYNIPVFFRRHVEREYQDIFDYDKLRKYYNN